MSFPKQYQRIIALGHSIAHEIDTQFKLNAFPYFKQKYDDQRDVKYMDQHERRIVQRTGGMTPSLNECPAGMRLMYHIFTPRNFIGLRDDFKASSTHTS